MESGQAYSRTEPQRYTVGRVDDNVGGERDSSPTPAKLRLRTLDCCSPLGGCLGTEGNAEALVRSPVRRRGYLGVRYQHHCFADPTKVSQARLLSMSRQKIGSLIE